MVKMVYICRVQGGCKLNSDIKFTPTVVLVLKAFYPPSRNVLLGRIQSGHRQRMVKTHRTRHDQPPTNQAAGVSLSNSNNNKNNNNVKKFRAQITSGLLGMRPFVYAVSASKEQTHPLGGVLVVSLLIF